MPPHLKIVFVLACLCLCVGCEGREGPLFSERQSVGDYWSALLCEEELQTGSYRLSKGNDTITISQTLAGCRHDAKRWLATEQARKLAESNGSR